MAKKNLDGITTIAKFFCILMLILPTITYAQTIDLPYSGRITEADGSPIVGAVDLLIEFYRSETSKGNLGDPTLFRSVPLNNGVFQVNIALPAEMYNQIFSSVEEQVWIQVTDATNNTVYPRQLLGATPYALKIPVDGKTVGWNTDGRLEVLPGASVNTLGGQKFETSGAANGQVLTWDNAKKIWKPAAASSGSMSSITAGAGLSGGTINSAGTIAVAPAGIVTSMIADGAVTAAKLAAGAVSRSSITAGTAGEVVVNDGTGLLHSEARLAVSRGGTGAATSGSNLVFAGPTSGGPAAPSFRGLAASDIPSPAGDISGTYAASTVAKIQGTAVSATTPTTGQILSYNGTNWSPTGKLELAPGASGPNGAPIKLSSGANLTAPEVGAVEFDGSSLMYTNNVPARLKVVAIDAAAVPVSGQVLSWNGSAWVATAVTGTGTVTGVTAGTGLSGGTISSSGTLALANTTVTPAAYTRANITVDAQGRITAAANGSSVNLAADVSGILPTANGGTGAASLGTNAVLTSNGSGALSAQSGTTSQVLIGSAVSNPSFGQISDAQIAAAAGIARTKIASGTLNHVLINDGSGNISSEAQLDVSRGGTGAATAANNLIFAGPASGGPAAPGFRSLAASDLPAPGGDLSGSFATATVAKLRGVAVSAAAPTTGQILSYDGTSWVPAAAATGFTGSLAGDVTGTQGATAISAATVTGKAITGFTSAAGTVAATDTILGAIQKIDGNDALRAPIASPTFTGTVTAPIVKGGSATTSPLTFKTTSGVGTTGADHIFQVGNNGATEAMRILNSGNVGVGTTAPTAALQLKAGAATAGGAPLKLTSGTNLTTAEAGAIEYNGTDLFYTNGAATRQKIAGYDNSLTPSSGQVLSWNGSAWAPASAGDQGIYQTGTQSNYFAGNVGIGTSESDSPLAISSLPTLSAGVFSGLSNMTEFSNTTAASTRVYGINNTTYFGGSANSTGAGYGIYTEAMNGSGFNVDTMYGSYAVASNAGNGSTVTNQYGSYSTSRATRSVTNSYGSYSLASKPSGETATVTNAYGSYNAVDNSVGTTTIAYGSYNTVTNGASLGTGYGLYIGPVAGITNYGIYQEMTSNDNYFAGKIGLGTTTPSAVLQLKAGAATAGSAPLKLTSGTNLTTAEAGAIEYNGTDLFYTNGSAARQKIASYNNSLTPTSGQVLSWNGSAWAPASVGGSGTVTSITVGTGLSGGTITSTGTIALANTAVTPAAYTRANITVDAQGRITAAANSSAVSLTADVTGTLPAANGGTGAASLGTNAVLTSNGSGTLSAQSGTTSQVLIGSAVTNPSFGQISDAQIAAAAGIARTKVATGTLNHVLINDGSGNLSSEAQLGVSRGGTGAATAANNLVFAGPTTGGPSAPAFRSLAASDLPAPGGDLSGSFATATVAKIQGVAVSATTPTTGQVLSYNGTNWVPTADGFSGSLAGDVTGTQGATAISAGTVTGKALTGYVSGAGAVAATDSILGAIQKLNGNDALNAPLASPIFTGTVTSPILMGGTGTTSSITYKTTSGVGATGADHIFKVGNNGATEAMRILNNGNIGIGTSAPSLAVDVLVPAATDAITWRNPTYQLGRLGYGIVKQNRFA